MDDHDKSRTIVKLCDDDRIRGFAQKTVQRVEDGWLDEHKAARQIDDEQDRQDEDDRKQRDEEDRKRWGD